MQLSIPSFILGTPTVYKIIATSDGGAVEIDKRYNDFIQLAQDFAAEMGEQVPIPPPAKRWFGNNDATSCEERRIELEVMVRALVRNPEYLQTLAVQDFLQLGRREPSHNTDWLQVSSRIDSLLARAKHADAANQRRKLALEAKSYLAQLKKLQAGGTTGIGQGEQTRRAAMLEGFQSTINKLELQSARTLGNAGARDQLFSAPGRVLGETDVTRKLNNTQLLDHQQSVIKSQDAQLQQLSGAISHQRALGLAIDDELTKQNSMLEQLDSHVHIVNSKVNQAKRKTSKLN